MSLCVQYKGAFMENAVQLVAGLETQYCTDKLFSFFFLQQ